jgi:hypothetical protein
VIVPARIPSVIRSRASGFASWPQVACTPPWRVGPGGDRGDPPGGTPSASAVSTVSAPKRSAAAGRPCGARDRSCSANPGPWVPGWAPLNDDDPAALIKLVGSDRSEDNRNRIHINRMIAHSHCSVGR